MPERQCEDCGCTDANACVVDGVPCHWVAPTLCSACQDRLKALLDSGMEVTDMVIDSVSLNSDGTTTTRMLLGFANGETMLVDWPGQWTAHTLPKKEPT